MTPTVGSMWKFTGMPSLYEDDMTIMAIVILHKPTIVILDHSNFRYKVLECNAGMTGWINDSWFNNVDDRFYGGPVLIS